MSLLCGFIGQRDDSKLAQMTAQARHKGLQKITTTHFKNLHLAHASDPCSSNLAGIIHNEHSLIALAGIPRAETTNLLEKLTSNPNSIHNLLDSLTGSYAGLIHHQETLYLFRDKSGRRTLFYTTIDPNIHFATESKILHHANNFSPTIRPSSLAQYLAFSYVPGENTMLEGIKEILSGSYFSTHTHTHQQHRYFTPELQSTITSSDWIKEFQTRFTQSIERTRPASMTDFAVFLSGGIDSSIVTAALAEIHGSDKVKTFGIHFGKHFPNELEYIRAVAEFTNVECEEVEVNPKSFLPYLHEIVNHLNDPIGDPVTMPNYLLAKHVAAQGYHGVYNGEGGDPIFGGPKNMTMLLHHWYGDQQPQSKNHREKAYLASYRRSYEEINHLLTPEWQRKINPEHDLESILSPMFQQTKPDSFLKKLLLINMRQKGAHLILPKVERMLGANGLTPLSPLFDESLIQLCMSLPGEHILKNGIEKMILKQAFRGKLPDSIIDRPKSGMRVPVHYWFKGEMKRYAKKMLSKKRLDQTGIFDPNRVKQLLNYTTNEGPGRYGIKLWMLLTFELWREKVFE
ncbi:MAG: asparagine synthetase B family protein [Akkermansiaceae bacterium]